MTDATVVLVYRKLGFLSFGGTGRVFNGQTPEYRQWQDRTSRAPPDVDGLVQDLDFGFSTPQNSPRQSNQAQDVSYQDIDTFLASF